MSLQRTNKNLRFRGSVTAQAVRPISEQAGDRPEGLRPAATMLRGPRGHRFLVPVLIVAMFIAASSEAGAQTPRLDASVDRSAVYEGESITYSVKVTGIDDAPEPEVDAEDWNVRSMGRSSSIRRVVINGRDVSSGSAVTFNYALTPRRAGKLTIPPPRLNVDGTMLTGQPVTVTVIPPKKQDQVVLTIDVDKASVYPMQPFEVTLQVDVKGIPAPYVERNPLMVQNVAPQLLVPWFNDQELPDGIEPLQPLDQVVRPWMNQRNGGFQINDIRQQRVSILFGSQAIVFLPRAQRVSRLDDAGEEAEYWRYEFRRSFRPVKVGSYTFGPARLKGAFATGATERGLEAGEVYTFGDPVTVEVRSAPLDDRPESFTGAVGEFDFAATVSPVEARVGEPITLTLSVDGVGTFDDIAPPQIDRIPEVADGFKTYDATEESTATGRRFSYSLRPLKSGIESFPPVEFSYFDVASEEYVSISTDPIPVNITEAEQLDANQIVAGVRAATAGEDGIELSEDGIFGNRSDLSQLRDEGVRPARWAMAWGGIVVVWLFGGVAFRRWQRSRGDVGLGRRRSAANQARTRLRAAGDDPDEMRAAIVGFIADALNEQAAGMTPGDVRQRLQDLSLQDDVLDATSSFLEQCDAARYSPAAARRSQELSQTAKRVLDELIRKFGERKLLR